MLPPAQPISSGRRRSRGLTISVGLLVAFAAASSLQSVAGQLPDDIQRELNQNLAEQARIQARQAQLQRQQLIQSRARGASGSPQQQAQQQQPSSQSAGKHDPNNYSYQQVSPPIQYSYYQPYGDAAGQPQEQQQQESPQAPAGAQNRGSSQAANQPKLDFDLNNLNFDLPQPQAQVAPARQQPQQQVYTPSFTGAGGLPVLKPIAASQTAGAEPALGAPPLAPQARVQQGPPLTEADFKDITGGENYGAPGGNDFGLGDATSSASGPQSRASSSDTDAQLREFGLPAEPQQRRPAAAAAARRLDSMTGGMNIPDFGGFNPLGGAASQQPSARANDAGGGGGDFGDFGNEAGASGGGGGASPSSQSPGGNEFDFAGQPSQQSGDQAASSARAGGAPGSLQSLLGAGFPGLGGGGGDPSLDADLARPASQQSNGNQQRADDGALDIADMGDRADGFSGDDFGGGAGGGQDQQPGPQSDRDFGLAAAAANQQPTSVPYPDGSPQPVGTLWALTQPQSLTQTRYNALPDKGTYQDYPAYASGGNDFGAVAGVVDATPAARAPGPGRYGRPSAQALAPEVRQSLAANQQYDYGREPAALTGEGGGGSIAATGSDNSDDFFPFD